MSGEEDMTVGTSILDSFIPFFSKILTVVVGLVAVAAGFLYYQQDSLLYFPEIGELKRSPKTNPRRYRSPREHNLPFEEHHIECQDGVRIHSWLLLQPDSKRKRSPTLIFFHGNAGNIGLRIPNAIQMYQNLQCNILMVEYRGYGDSDLVKPNEAGLKLDAEAALRFISSHHSVDNSRLFVFGRSLGGAVAFHLAQYAESNSLPLAGVIVENTFLSISNMVDHLMPLVAPLKPLVLRIGWNSFRIAPRLKTPILYLAGAKDQLVPHSHMLELFKMSKAVSQCARIFVVKKGTHNETWLQGGSEYWHRIQSFFSEVYAFMETSSFRSESSMGLEEISLEKQTSSVAVGMGGETSKSSIPIVPGNLMGMARAATNAALGGKGKSGKTE